MIYTSPQNSTDILDAEMNIVYPNNNGSALAIFALGNNKYSSNDTVRELMQFPDMLSKIPSNATVKSAKLYLTYNRNAGADYSLTVNIYRMKRAVVMNQCTWNIYATGLNWQTAGATGADDRDTSILVGSFTITTSTPVGTVFEITLNTSIIQSFIDGTWTTPTLGFFGTVENDNLYYFDSSDATTAANRPKIVVEYDAPGGVSGVFISDFGVM